MSKVLVAFDGSDTATKALIQAVKLFKPSKLYVLYVINEDDIRWPSRIDISVIWGGNIQELESNILELHRKHAQKILQKAKNILKGKKAKIFYEIGNPSDVILKKSEELSCDIIVIGSRSKSQLEFILGSVAERVAARSKVSVFIVKPDSRKS
ncbi:MAG: universal stress protein [Candidatus Calescibacterium sp.]|nr:universal stress protein [Candidatus Calescibacterium sp.]MCX7734897.1 universal stress protein [bacterium]MDW8086588.1 universal stress protein [Candidatus Calescibacterium sp.]